jgi:hypothetical protein
MRPGQKHLPKCGVFLVGRKGDLDLDPLVGRQPATPHQKHSRDRQAFRQNLLDLRVSHRMTSMRTTSSTFTIATLSNPAETSRQRSSAASCHPGTCSTRIRLSTGPIAMPPRKTMRVMSSSCWRTRIQNSSSRMLLAPLSRRRGNSLDHDQPQEESQRMANPLTKQSDRLRRLSRIMLESADFARTHQDLSQSPTPDSSPAHAYGRARAIVRLQGARAHA